LTIWDTILPPELLKLNDELAKIDAILEDQSFMAPFTAKFNTRDRATDGTGRNLPEANVSQVSLTTG